jgi:serine/threonine protein phosphatase PrpC
MTPSNWDGVVSAKAVTDSSILSVSIGQVSVTGKRGTNEDFLGAVTPEGAVLRDKGVALVVADGVGKGQGGRKAAEISVRRFLSDYYASPDTWSVQKSLEQTLTGVNRSVRELATKPGAQSMARTDSLGENKNGAATFVCLVVRGNRVVVANVGDARAYLYRNGELLCLTQDHVWDHPDFRNVVSRSMGLDEHLHPDFAQDAVQLHDVFLLCSDGLYKSGSLDAEALRRELRQDLNATAETLAKQAQESGSDDDISVMLLRIDALPSPESLGRIGETFDLAARSDIREGLTLDDFYLAKRIHRGQMSEVYLADDLRRGKKVVLKFPRIDAANPEAAQAQLEMFLKEEWVGRRIQNRHVLPALAIEPGRRTCLYYATPYTPGETLRRKLEMGQPLPASEAVEWIVQVAKGLEALHRLQVLHRDIKPDNILINSDGEALIMDLGVAQTEGFTQETKGKMEVPGTPSYMAPEFFLGGQTQASEASEIYALGATLYELVTRKLPFGEIEPFSQPRFNRWTPPSRYNPQIPVWLETVIQKATQPSPEKRFQALSELRFHLERREAVANEDAPRRPVAAVSQANAKWRAFAWLFAMVALLEFIYILQHRP